MVVTFVNYLYTSLSQCYNMKETVTRHRFIDLFMKIRPDNFSRLGLHALFDYIEELEEDTGQEIEFDVIALCCDFSEYKDINEISEVYDKDFSDSEDLGDYTQIIDFEGGIIIQDW